MPRYSKLGCAALSRVLLASIFGAGIDSWGLVFMRGDTPKGLGKFDKDGLGITEGTG